MSFIWVLSSFLHVEHSIFIYMGWIVILVIYYSVKQGEKKNGEKWKEVRNKVKKN